MSEECKRCHESFTVPDGYESPESGLCWPCAEVVAVELEAEVKRLREALLTPEQLDILADWMLLHGNLNSNAVYLSALVLRNKAEVWSHSRSKA